MALDGLLQKLISNQQSPFIRWQIKQQILQHFSTIAEQSIIESSRTRDLFLSQLESFIYQKPFDSLFGGLLIPMAKGYHKPLIINLYLAEILAAADQVFYDGRFRAMAQQIGQLCCDFLQGNTSRTRVRLEIEFSGKQLNRLLDENEINLFKALINPSSHSIDRPQAVQSYLYSTHCTLKKAGKEIAMEYKQAQIIEYSLIQKLLSTKHPFYLSEETLLTKLEENFVLLRSMSKLFPQTKSEQICCLVKERFEQLIDCIKKTQLDVYQLIELAYCGINILQINFDHPILERTIKIWQTIENKIDELVKNSKQEYQIKIIVTFLHKIVEHLQIDIDIKNMAINLNSEDKRNIEIIVLAKNQIDLDRQLIQCRSKFNPDQHIFVI